VKRKLAGFAGILTMDEVMPAGLKRRARAL